MNLVHYDLATFEDLLIEKKPCIFFGKLGKCVYFNKDLIKALELEPGEPVRFSQDEDTGEWYLSLGVQTGIPLRRKSDGHGLYVQNCKISFAIAESYEEELPLRFSVIVDEPVELEKVKYYKLEAAWYEEAEITEEK